MKTVILERVGVFYYGIITLENGCYYGGAVLPGESGFKPIKNPFNTWMNFEEAYNECQRLIQLSKENIKRYEKI
mgnify:CR=1 FL=1